MGTLAAGIKEIFATAKTTGSNVMLCGNDGTPDGHMTMANLASILGVANDVTSGSANSFIISGKYFLRASVTDTPFHPNAESLLEVFAGSSINYYILQRVSSYGGFQDFYIRYSLNNGKSWSEWIGFVGNMPTFYKNYADLRSLANALGGIGETGSLARIVASGVLSSLYNPPTGYGTIIRFNAYYNVYICINYNGTGLWIAGDIGSGETENLKWYQVFQAT